jgi:hypothetical protein
MSSILQATISTRFITCKQTYCSLDPYCCGGSLSGRPTMPAPHAATSLLISDPNWGVHIAILRDIRACLTAANKSFMQWDIFGWSLRGQTWTNLCWSLCLRHVEVCCTFLTYYWTCENIWSSHTFCCLTKCRPNYLREFSHMLQSGMLCGHWLQVVAVF